MLAILDSQQMTHYSYQPIIVHVLYLYIEPFRGHSDELLEVVQTSRDMADEVLFEHEAPSLDDVEESLLERTSIDLEPHIKYYCVLEGGRERERGWEKALSQKTNHIT